MKLSLNKNHPVGLLAMLVVSVAMLAACNTHEPPAKVDVGHGFKVQKLFTHDGCTVYRFYDDGEKYFTRCDGAAASASASAAQWKTGSKVKTHHVSMTGYVND